jgi:hypothetical protein
LARFVAENDKKQLLPMLEQVQVLTGSKPEQATADAGYFTEERVGDAKLEGINLLVAPDRQKHGAEWKLICATHPSADGLKLFQSGWSPQSA